MSKIRNHNNVIRYLNTDLDIESNQPFNKLVQCFKKMQLIEMHYCKNESGKIWSGCFEIEMISPKSPELTPELTISKFIKTLNGLSGEELKEWNRCKKKTFNIGYDCGKKPWAFTNSLPSPLIEKLNKHGLGIAITIYPERRKK